MEAIREIWTGKINKLKTAMLKRNTWELWFTETTHCWGSLWWERLWLWDHLPLVCEGLQSLPAEGQRAASVLCAARLVPAAPQFSVKGQSGITSRSSRPAPFPRLTYCFFSLNSYCRWKSVVVFGQRINKIFDSERVYGAHESILRLVELPLCFSYKQICKKTKQNIIKQNIALRSRSPCETCKQAALPLP